MLTFANWRSVLSREQISTRWVWGFALIYRKLTLFIVHFISFLENPKPYRLIFLRMVKRLKFPGKTRPTKVCPDSYMLLIKIHISCTCTHHVLLLAQSWWCFPRWVPIHQTPQRNYHTGYHHWHRNTPQLSLRLKEARGMNYSLLKADNRGRGRGTNTENHPSKTTWGICARESRWQVMTWFLPQLMCLTDGCC